MPFRLALSGLNAASQDLTVTANNIANVGTNGFKGSRAEFAEMFAVSPQGVSSTAIGNGVRVASVSQQFSQGNIDNTGNSLDLGAQRPGLLHFERQRCPAVYAGRCLSYRWRRLCDQFRGQRLQVFPPASGGGFNTGALTDLQLQTGTSAPNATSNVQMMVNLPADAALPATMPFDPTNTDTYNRATSLTVYDSLGAAHTGTVYFQKTAPGQWNSYLFVDGTSVGATGAATAGTGTGTVDATSLTYPSSYALSVNGTAVGTGAANSGALATDLQTAVDAAVVAGGGAAGDAVVSLNGSTRS